MSGLRGMTRADIAARRQRVIDHAQAGKSTAWIAHTEDITERSVLRIIVECGVRPPIDTRLTADESAWARALLEDGCPYSEVARTLGRNIGTIRRHFPGMGLAPGEGAWLGKVAL